MNRQNDRKLLELAATAAGWMPNNSWAWDDHAERKERYINSLAGLMAQQICFYELPSRTRKVAYHPEGYGQSLKAMRAVEKNNG